MFMKVTPLWREAIRQGMTFALKNHQFPYEHLFWCVGTCTHMCMLHAGVNTIACLGRSQQSTQSVFLYHSQPCLLNKVFH